MIDLQKLVLGLQSDKCPICKEFYWRIIRTTRIEDMQNKTTIFEMEYICQKCGAEESHRLEFSDTFIIAE